MKRFGGIEGGGTKFVCIVASGPDDVVAETRFPTTTPDETLGRAIAFFQEQAAREPIESIGFATFGPLDLNPASTTCGYITSTPKPGWAWTDVVGPIRQALDVPVAFETDVNAAALGEFTWGAGVGIDPLIYYTIGTGIGAGIIVNGAPVHGLVHPEAGHVRVTHDRVKDPFAGRCPYHGDCFEGLACGPAMNDRWGARAETLPADHPAWELEAGYIASALSDQVFILSPRRIILGGGVMQQFSLFPLIRRMVVENLNNYISSKTITENIDDYIVPPGLGGRSGVMGAIALAQHVAG